MIQSQISFMTSCTKSSIFYLIKPEVLYISFTFLFYLQTKQPLTFNSIQPLEHFVSSIYCINMSDLIDYVKVILR